MIPLVRINLTDLIHMKFGNNSKDFMYRTYKRVDKCQRNRNLLIRILMKGCLKLTTLLSFQFPTPAEGTYIPWFVDLQQVSQGGDLYILWSIAMRHIVVCQNTWGSSVQRCLWLDHLWPVLHKDGVREKPTMQNKLCLQELSTPFYARNRNTLVLVFVIWLISSSTVNHSLFARVLFLLIFVSHMLCEF